MTRGLCTWGVVLGIAVVPAALAANDNGNNANGNSGNHNGAEVRQPVAHDVSKPLRDIDPSTIPQPAFRHQAEPKRVPVDTTPREDAAVQGSSLPLVAASPGVGFEGVGMGNGYRVNAAPPDTNGSVGDTQFVQWVNSAFAVFDKTGKQLYPATGGAPGNAIFSGFTAGHCDTNNDGDPIILWDKVAKRWLATQFSVTGGPPYYQCIAVSTTADATGTWNRYAYSFDNGFNDYPKFGIFGDTYFGTYNIFTNGTTGAGSKACAYNRAAMIAGQSAPQQVCFATAKYSLLPADVDGATQPAAGTPEYFVDFGTNVLNIWRMNVDWTNTANSTFTGPTALTVASFSPACGGGTCIPQAGTTQQLDSLGDRLMYRFAWRKFADGHEALVVNHSVKVGSNKRSTYTAVRWYELRVTNGALAVYQQGTFSPDSNSRWMGSAAMDKVGNIAVAYNKSSSSMKPSIFYTGRYASDPAGSMQSEQNLLTGTGAQLRSLSRWGDYSSLSVDPVDDCTFWYTTEYLANDGTFNWRTWVGTFKFPNCN